MSTKYLQKVLNIFCLHIFLTWFYVLLLKSFPNFDINFLSQFCNSFNLKTFSHSKDKVRTHCLLLNSSNIPMLNNAKNQEYEDIRESESVKDNKHIIGLRKYSTNQWVKSLIFWKRQMRYHRLLHVHQRNFILPLNQLR